MTGCSVPTVLRLKSSRRPVIGVTAADPVSGRTDHADEPDLLLWVHNTIQWMVLRVTDSCGPALSSADNSTYLTR